MGAISPLAILLFGIALGVCLPVLIIALRKRYRRWSFRPTLLHLDPPPPMPSPAVSPASTASAPLPADRS